MLSHAEIISGLKQMVTELNPGIDVTSANEDTCLVRDLGMDSLTLLLLALKSEKHYGIRFENMQVSSFRTVGDVCRYIEGKLQ